LCEVGAGGDQTHSTNIRRQQETPVGTQEGLIHTNVRSGGARVFAARGKRLCCRPPTQWRI